MSRLQETYHIYIELFLIIVNGLRRSLKIWQGSWIDFKFACLLLLHMSVTLFPFILKEFLSTIHTDIFGFCIGSILNKLTQKFKEVSKCNCL